MKAANLFLVSLATAQRPPIEFPKSVLLVSF